jgi:hypothetical protein
MPPSVRRWLIRLSPQSLRFRQKAGNARALTVEQDFFTAKTSWLTKKVGKAPEGKEPWPKRSQRSCTASLDWPGNRKRPAEAQIPE